MGHIRAKLNLLDEEEVHRNVRAPEVEGQWQWESIRRRVVTRITSDYNGMCPWHKASSESS